ncbi:MAG TPA: 30S ribosomal protein S16 [Candidatus Bathyarchaeia archaeon]|nr:30S ribosomal protein S16 [Candidatus Bathyarchaeia archaeon]
MATVIRLKRGGRTHAPCYRVVVMDSRSRAQGREIDILGYYHPCAKPAPVIEVDKIKALDWLAKGARTTDTVRSIFSTKGIVAPERVAGQGSTKKAEDMADATSEAAAAE